MMRVTAALLLFAVLGACSAAPSDPSADTAMVTPTTAGLTSGPGETQPPAPDIAAEPAPAAEEPAPEAPVEPAVSHLALKYLIGDVDPAGDPKFARIPEKYIGGSRVWGHKDAVDAFVRMAEDAEQDGYKLKIVSAFRSFSDQKQIWEGKWTGKTLVGGKKLNKSLPDPAARAKKILEFSSMPGTSRHHWGTDFDFNSLENSYFTNNKDGRRIYDWLVNHAANYGFCQVYTSKTGEGARPTGYEEEKWHWSYAPLSSWYLRQYPIGVGYERLTGFLGSETAQQIDVIPNYVQGINPECMQ
jgi:LAS superfamily LD-carboxypeptidase LdcB